MSVTARVRLVAAAACVVLYGFAGFFILPPIVRAQAEKRLSAASGRSVSIGRLRMNPYMLSVTLEDFDVAERAGAGSFLGWRRLYVRFDAIRSLAGDWVLGKIELDGFHASVVVNPDGSFNFSDVLAKFISPVPALQAKAGRAVRIGSLKVAQASVAFSDRSLRHPFTTTVGPATFELTDFRAAGRRGAPYQFAAETEAAERLTWNGTLSADPFESHGAFDVENVALKKYSPYTEARTQADVTAGKLGLKGRYAVDLDPKGRLLSLSDCDLRLSGLRVAERATGNAVLELNTLDVTGIQADAVAYKASVGRVALSGGHLAARRNKDGSVNLLALIAPGTQAPAHPAGAAPPAPARAPELTAGEVEVKDFTVDFADDAAARRALLSVGALEFSLRNFSLADGASMPVHLAFSWAPRGAVKADGAVTLKPLLKADLKASVSALEILPLSPYIEKFVNARISQGTVTATGSARASMSSGSPSVAFEGDASVDGFGLVDAAHDMDLLGFSRLALADVRFANAPRITASIGRVDVDGPYVRVRVDADRSLNIASLVESAGPAPSAPAAGAAAPAPAIEIGRVAVSGGDFSFTDRSVEPNVRVSLGDFAGTVLGLSSENLERADVALKGTVGGAGPVEITGKLDPLGAHRYVGLKVDVRNVDLVPLSPYAGKYAGFELARGQLVVDSKLLLDGEKLEATNLVTLNQFTFGAPTASPDATALPVRLGVALLKDVDGRIVIDLPVQGSLGDPEFRIGKVVLRVIVNLLTKAAVSPFSLLGSMFGGGEELSFQEFAPGSSELLASDLAKLETLAKALANRPALSLGLEGGYDSAADAYALGRSKLADLVRRQIWEERRASDPDIPAPDKLQVSAEENAAMVKKLFDAKFPPGTKFGTPLPPAPAVSPPPPGRPPGLLARIVDALTFRKQREQAAERKRADALAAKHESEVAKAVAAGLPLEEMTGRLAGSMNVTSDDLRALAAERAQRVRDRLINSGHIAADRLFLVQGKDQGRRENGPRVLLSLQ
ncbi:MAG TPA: DUF748 domain-containing protein [Opitutaceae bacterium]|nr:DUF748 domain-containing protein [Opitutaceae bacterium]